MLNNPKVSVIIPAYNAAKTISACLQSLFVQTYPEEQTEIIVVNDGSTDNTLKILTSDEYKDKITVLDNEANLALAATRNNGYKKSTGDIIISLDSDMTVEPTFIQQHVDFHKKPGVIGVIGKLNPGPDIIMDKFQRYLYEGKRGPAKRYIGYPIPYNYFLFQHSSIKKEILEKVGFQDESITSYGGEDTEYAFRIWQQYPDGLYYAPDIKVHHNHYRSFSDHLENLHKFGKTVIPYLVAKHREMAPAYGLDYLSECQSQLPRKSGFLKLFIGSILKCRIFYGIFRFMQKICPFPLSNFWTRLCIISSLFQGAVEGLMVDD